MVCTHITIHNYNRCHFFGGTTYLTLLVLYSLICLCVFRCPEVAAIAATSCHM